MSMAIARATTEPRWARVEQETRNQRDKGMQKA